MRRYFLEVSYDGTAFHGSQVQGDLPTVQAALNKAIATLVRQPIETFGASRTDEGVHALSNYYHFDVAEPLHPHFHYKINAILPEAVSVKAIYAAEGLDFNARFDAQCRTYRYRVYHFKNPFLANRALFFPYRYDRAVLDETAAIIKSYQNFESFSKRASQTKTFLCTIFDSHWEDAGQEIHYVVRANRFLRGMVRGLVSTQLQTARGRWDVAHFRAILDARDCTKADFNVPGHGLYLEEIQYPEGKLLPLHLM